jgi:hypothetical protein
MRNSSLEEPPVSEPKVKSDDLDLEREVSWFSNQANAELLLSD